MNFPGPLLWCAIELDAGCEVTFSVRAETSFGDRIVPLGVAFVLMRRPSDVSVFFCAVMNSQ